MGKVEILSSDRVKVFGNPTIRSITSEVILDTELSGYGKDPMSREVISFNAST